MTEQEAHDLRRAIELLVNAKLHDVLHPGGLGRLGAHRATGVASVDIRNAERHLESALNRVAVPGCKPRSCTSQPMN